MYTATFNEGREANYIFDKQKSLFRKKGFTWCVYFVALKCEANNLYEEIREKWSDLDAVTGKDIAFVIADDSSSTILHLGNEIERMQYVPRGKGHSFAETNTIMAPMGMEVFGVSYDQIPCLVFRNLLNDSFRPIIIPVRDDSDLFSIFKYLSIRCNYYTDSLKEITRRISRGYRGIETYLDMVNRFINVSNGYVYKGEHAEQILNRLPNSYAEQRLIEYWDVVAQRKKAIWGNSQISSLADKIIKLRRELGDAYEGKKEEYLYMISEAEMIQNELYEVVKNIDVSRCKEDALEYALSQVKELKDVVFTSNLSVPVDVSEVLDEVRILLKCEESIKNNRQLLLEKIEAVRNSQFVKLLDDYGRVVALISIIRKLVLFLA